MSLRTLKRRSDLIGNLSKYGFSSGSKRYAYAIYNERIASKHNIYQNVNIPTASERLEELKLKALDPSYNEHLLEGLNYGTMNEEYKKDDDTRTILPSIITIGDTPKSQISSVAVEDMAWQYNDHGVQAVEIDNKIYLLDFGSEKMHIYNPTDNEWVEVDLSNKYYHWKLTDIDGTSVTDSGPYDASGDMLGDFVPGDIDANKGVLFDNSFFDASLNLSNVTAINISATIEPSGTDMSGCIMELQGGGESFN